MDGNITQPRHKLLIHYSQFYGSKFRMTSLL